jgi:hypothetical protein
MKSDAESLQFVDGGGRMSSRKHLAVAAIVVAATITIFTANHILVGSPVSKTLEADSRNSGFTLKARFLRYLQPSTLVLNLTTVDSAAPVDLLRGLFQSADVLNRNGRTFEHVILAKEGQAIFSLSGKDFQQLGIEFGNGQNPVYLIRTLPEKLKNPDGSSAYGTWSGGLLGVLQKQMEDVNDATTRWAKGSVSAER